MDFTCHQNIHLIRKLSVGGNSISGIPDEISQLVGLQELYLSKNRISNLPDCFSTLRQLRHLSLAGNLLHSCDVLKKLTNLESLSLFGNPLSEDSSGTLKGQNDIDDFFANL